MKLKPARPPVALRKAAGTAAVVVPATPATPATPAPMPELPPMRTLRLGDYNAVSTGVYYNANRSTAIVVRAVNGAVTFLSLSTGTIELNTCSEDSFRNEYCIKLLDYPILRALRHYQQSLLPKTPQAAQALRIVIAKLAAQ